MTVSVLVLALEAVVKDASILMGLRVLRALKALRMLTRSAGMRIVFKSLMLSLAAMANEYINPTTQQLEPREWSNTFPNFDNVGSSLFVCFVTSTLNGYTATMMQVGKRV